MRYSALKRLEKEYHRNIFEKIENINCYKAKIKNQVIEDIKMEEEIWKEYNKHQEDLLSDLYYRRGGTAWRRYMVDYFFEETLINRIKTHILLLETLDELDKYYKESH